MEKDIYMVVADNDKSHKMPNQQEPYFDKKGPIAFETYINHASIEEAEAFILRLNGSYGKCRIAKLVFVEDGE